MRYALSLARNARSVQVRRVNAKNDSDGLLVRPREIHSFRKPMLLRYYLNPLTRIVSNNFARTCYLDGFSGPGVVRFTLGNEHYDIDGSPLIALRAKPGFTDYYFCDSDKRSRDALETRIGEIQVSRNVEVLPAQDFNVCLPSILSVIPADCFIFAFLDPDGLTLDWSTVASIGSRRHKELLINFSNGVARCAQTARTNPKHRERMKSFMGSDDEWWHYTSEEILDTYKTNLKSLGTGFKHVLDLPVKNQTQTIVYNLLFATNNDTAVKILRDRMRRLEGLTTEHLRVLFLREQGEEVEDLAPFLEGAKRIDRREPDPRQTQLLKYVKII